MRRARRAAAIACLIAASACAPLVAGGAPLSLSPEMATHARLGRIESEMILNGAVAALESDGVSLGDYLNSEVAQELGACATGDHSLDVRIRITASSLEEPGEPYWMADENEYIVGAVELFDPTAGEIVGRYEVHASLPSPREMQGMSWSPSSAQVAGESFGRALCMEVFGRNPRPSSGNDLTN